MKTIFVRFSDILISIIFLIILFPLIILTSVIILFSDGRPIFFKQIRVGKNGKKFKMYKFRTMKNINFKNENQRIIKFGKIIRRLSIDEIPQFFNVINNEMSIVGPRPLPEKIEKKINKTLRQKRRKVLPGITGMSQINYKGHNRKLVDKVNLDIKYINNNSVDVYFKILFSTPFVLIIRLLKNKSSIIK